MDNVLIGRRQEKDELLDLLHSGRAEFVTAYGRRCVYYHKEACSRVT